jgi:D-xylose transport system permease protein
MQQEEDNMSQTNVNRNKGNESTLQLLTQSLRGNLKQYVMFIALIVIGIVFTILTDGTFMTARNLSNLLLQTAVIAVLACGMVLVIIGGHIDLSVGSVAGFTGAVAAVLQSTYGWGTFAAYVSALLVGLLVGLWQGFWVAYQGLPAFIVTLGGWLGFRGACLAVTGGQTIGDLKPSFTAIGESYLPRLFTKTGLHDTTLILGVVAALIFIAFEIRTRRKRISYGFEVLAMPLEILKVVFILIMIGLFFSIMVTYMGMPYCILLLIGIIILYTYIANMTPFGRYVYAIGGNKDAAKLSGINIRKTNLLIFISMGVLSAVAGIMFTARMNSATAGAGNLFELDAIAACFIGGASTYGGEGTVIGAIIGAFVMASINNGMSLMNIDVMYTNIVKGLILILAVWIDIKSRTKNA